MITAVMVGLDAREDQPRVVSTFTTRDPITPEKLRDATAYILKLVRSELGPVRCCSFLEFTTGRARTSGRRRRPHLHTLWKDLDPSDSHVVSGIASYVLERACGAYRQEVDEIRTPSGATMYVARHHLKESQAPPAWWGPTRRVRPTRGYWSAPSTQLREQSSAIVREKRVRRRIMALIDQAEDELGIVLDDQERDEQVEKALSQGRVEVVKVCNPWEDPIYGTRT